MTVYIEYVLIDNLVIDYLLFSLTFALLGRSGVRKRLFLCSLLGATFALLYPLLLGDGIISVIGKVLFICLDALFVDNFSKFKDYLLFLTVLLMVTFLTGGIILGALNILGIKEYSEVCVATVILPVFITTKIIRYMLKTLNNKRSVLSLQYEVDLSLKDILVKAVGFMDTGNLVFNGNSPVIFCEKPFMKKFLTKFPLPKIFYVEIETVASKEKLPAIKIDKVVIRKNKTAYTYTGVTLCACRNVGVGYQIILNPVFLEGKEDEDFGAIKKTS